jgi:predicted metal-binding membrane protein
MVPLFVLGVMNLLWIAALTVLVLLEKFLHQPQWFVQLTGAALLVWAVLVVCQAVFLLS